jgi:hypothetical protein
MPSHQGQRRLQIDCTTQTQQVQEAGVARALKQVHQGQQCQRDKGNDTSATAQTRLDKGINAGTMTVTTPMQHEGKEVSRIMMATPRQQV